MTPSLIVKGRDGTTAREPLRIVPINSGQVIVSMKINRRPA